MIGLGSNIGDRRKNIRKAVQLLVDHDHIDYVKLSTLRETDAESDSPQPKYINGVVMLRTILSAQELLAFTKEVENTLGRTSKGSGEPRTIDLDILFLGDEIVCLEDLTVPHPLVHQREFTLTPLNEIAPDLVHPVFNESMKDLYSRVVGY